MKIAGTAGVGSEDLLARMREVAQAGRSEAASASAETSASTGLAAAQPEVEAVRALAARALAGEFASAAALRAEVAEGLLRARWSDRLQGKDLSRMVRELAPTLVDDPTFCGQVDQMLLMAARELDTK